MVFVQQSRLEKANNEKKLSIRRVGLFDVKPFNLFLETFPVWKNMNEACGGLHECEL